MKSKKQQKAFEERLAAVREHIELNPTATAGEVAKALGYTDGRQVFGMMRAVRGQTTRKQVKKAAAGPANKRSAHIEATRATVVLDRPLELRMQDGNGRVVGTVLIDTAGITYTAPNAKLTPTHPVAWEVLEVQHAAMAAAMQRSRRT